MIRQNVLRLALAMAAAAACGGASGGDYGTSPTNNPSTNNPPASPNTVMIADNAFNPTDVTVNAGTTVTWKWATCTNTGGGDGYGGYGSNPCPTHNVTFDDGSNIASRVQDAGDYSRAFSTPGTYKYHCSVHGASVMSGQIVVK
jgi:plastocyanin